MYLDNFKTCTALFLYTCFLLACKNKETKHTEITHQETKTDSLRYSEETHFKNVKQLTYGGNNAEAYWSFNDKMLSFQSDYSNWGASCDQIFYFNPFTDNLKDNKPSLISKLGGRTTCSFFMPGDTTIIFASTHADSAQCPQPPQRKPGGKYVWAVYKSFELYIADLNGNIKHRLTNNNFYDAEATLNAQGNKIVFTSDRSGDLELYTMDIDGKNIKQITNGLGYDGGAFFSADGKKLVFRASRPKSPVEQTEYKDLLKQGLVQPTNMEIYTCNVDGSDLKQITQLGKANWAPYFSPDGTKIIFSSNHKGARGFNFNLFMVNADGSGIEQITHDQTFDAFPMFSRDGKYLVFSSNRNNGGTHDTNLFLAEWQ